LPGGRRARRRRQTRRRRQARRRAPTPPRQPVSVMADEPDDSGEGAWTPTAVEDVHECPECGGTFKNASALATHRKIKHGVESQRDRDRQTGRRDRSPRRDGGGEQRQQRRQRQLRETLDELTTLTRELRGGSGEPPGDLG